MTSNETSSDSGGEADTGPADAFSALSDPLRVDIIRALCEHHRESQTLDPIGFADFRRRVGVDDPGRFRYHLQKLQEDFVEKTDEGYRLTYAGKKVVDAILMGTYTSEVSKDAAELDSDCFICDNPAVATYENGLCVVSCENDHPLFTWQVPPTAAAGATPAEIVEVAELLARQGLERALSGICTECYHPIETDVVVEESEKPILRAVCETCGARLISPVGYCLLANPRVAALYHRHGRDLDESHIWELSFIRDETALTVLEESPARVEVDASLEEETLEVTVNESGHAVNHRLSRR